MRWEDERYIRFYTRNTPEWLMLSWQARGLFGLLMREADRAGLIKVGKAGLRSLSLVFHAPWADLEPFLMELIEDGCIGFNEASGTLYIPNFIEAQEAIQSDAARKRKEREIARDKAGLTKVSVDVDTPKDDNVTLRDESTRDASRSSNDAAVTDKKSLCAVPSDPDKTKTPVPMRRPPGVLTHEMTFWIPRYEAGASKGLGHRFTFARREYGCDVTLGDLVAAHATPATAEQWVEDTAHAFTRAVADDPKWQRGYGPGAMLEWFNRGCPGRTPSTDAATNPERKEAPLENPTMSTSDAGAEAGRILAGLTGKIGKGGS